MLCRVGTCKELGRLCRLAFSALSLTVLGLPAMVLGQGEVSELRIGKDLAASSRYEAGGEVYLWGQGLNLRLEGFAFAGENYTRRAVAPKVTVRRIGNAVATGATCSLFAEVDRRPLSYQADFPGSVSGNCDFSTLFQSDIINRGAVDVFANRDDGALVTAGNIERLDFVFPDGMLLPPGEGASSKAGFLITEKGGNSWVKMAAITAVDSAGEPAAYGKLLTLAPSDNGDANALRYGMTDFSLDSDFLANQHTPPNGAVQSIDTRFTETIGAVFVSLQSLGLAEGDRVFGFSLFGADVTAQDNLLDPSTFPLDTERANTPDATGSWGGDADLYGGIAGYFAAASLHEISGTLFRDVDGSGTQSAGEDGVAGIRVTLYQDDGDGLFEKAVDAVVDGQFTSVQGSYRFIGLPEGQYWIGLDTQAAGFPKHYSLAGAGNPRLAVLNGSGNEVLDLALFPVTGADAALLAKADSYALMAGQPLRLDVLLNDRIPAGIQPRIVIAGAPAKGSVEIMGKALLYRPAPGMVGVDSLRYTLQGGAGEVSTTTVTLDIQPVATVDSDGDGQLDAVDPDDDNDGIPDFVEGAGDFDGDGIANQLDLDADGDGIFDIYESSLSTAAIRSLDSDNDGRIGAGLHYPLSPADYRIADTDGDGRPDYLDLDTDNDGIDDVIEAGLSDRNGDGRVDDADTVARRPPDTDGNGIADFRQLDSDADGRYDIAEAGLTDADGNGLVDHFVDKNFDGRNDRRTAVLGDEGSRVIDSNGNGVPDFQEVDASHLHTGVSGWGGGGSSVLYLIGLYMLSVSFRRRGLQRLNLGRAVGHD